jgi:hypothetical protein
MSDDVCPHHDEDAVPVTETLEDRFAMRALQGLLANPKHRGSFRESAEEAREYARACMADRSKK